MQIFGMNLLFLITSWQIWVYFRYRSRRAGSKIRRKSSNWNCATFSESPLDNIQNPIPVHISNSYSARLRENLRTSNCSYLRSIPHSSPFDNVTMHVWNANSIRNKTSTILDHVMLYVDIMCIVETKLLVVIGVIVDPIVIGEVTPPGYEFFNYLPGSTNYGGGIGIFAKKSLNLRPLPTHVESITFEHCIVTLKNHIQNVCRI